MRRFSYVRYANVFLINELLAAEATEILIFFAYTNVLVTHKSSETGTL